MLHEPLTATQKLTVIQMRQPSQAEVWRALMARGYFSSVDVEDRHRRR